MRLRIRQAVMLATALSIVGGTTTAMAGGSRSYSVAGMASSLPCPPMLGAVNPFVGTPYRETVLVAPMPTLCNECGIGSYEISHREPGYFSPTPGSLQSAVQVGGAGNSQQSGGANIGGNVYIGGTSSRVSGGWYSGNLGSGTGTNTNTATPTATNNAVVNYTNTNQTTNTSTNTITDSYNTTNNITVNKTYNIDNSSNVNFTFYVLGNSNAVNTGSGSSAVQNSGNNVGNTGNSSSQSGGSGGEDHHHRGGGVWNLSSSSSNGGTAPSGGGGEGGSGNSGGDTGVAS